MLNTIPQKYLSILYRSQLSDFSLSGIHFWLTQPSFKKFTHFFWQLFLYLSEWNVDNLSHLLKFQKIQFVLKMPSVQTHDIHAKSTQDLGFSRRHFQVHVRSWIVQDPYEGFQDWSRNLRGFPSFTFFTNVLIRTESHSKDKILVLITPDRTACFEWALLHQHTYLWKNRLVDLSEYVL